VTGIIQIRIPMLVNIEYGINLDVSIKFRFTRSQLPQQSNKLIK